MSKHWEVRGSLPPEGNRTYHKQQTCHVLALSAARAIELVEKKYAGITIWSVVHRGEIDVIEDTGGAGRVE